MISQGVGLDWLIPIALDRLGPDPLLEGDFYPGDLLVAISHVGQDYWKVNPGSLQRARVLVDGVTSASSPVSRAARDFLDRTRSFAKD
jgi:hypothetical protein